MKHNWATNSQQSCASLSTCNRSGPTTRNVVCPSSRVTVRQHQGVRMLEHAPEPYPEILRQAPEEVNSTFMEARLHIRCRYNQGRSFALSNGSTAEFHWSGAHADRCLSVVWAERPRTAKGRDAKAKERKAKVRRMTSPLKLGTTVKRNLLPMHLVTVMVRADTARSGVTRERTVADASKTSPAAWVFQQILLSLRT